MDPERTPVVVAAAQLTARGRDDGGADTPAGAAEMAIEVSAAALDAASGRLAGAINRVSVVNILARSGGPAPATGIARALDLRNASRCETTTVGGCRPQWLIQRAAADIAAGRLEATLIAGAEAVRSGRLRGQRDGDSNTGGGRRARSGGSARSGAGAETAGAAGAEAEPEPEADPVIGGDRLGCSEQEIAAGLYVPIHVYPLFESALAARAGRSPAEQRRVAAEVMAPFTARAAANPRAWFPIERTPSELATPTESNRLVAEPYTKLLTAFLGASQAAAVVVTSLAVARTLGLAEGAMFVRSSATADEVWFPSARPDLSASPAAGAVARAALGAAGLGLDELDHLDIYSCFPCAVEMSAAANGIALDDKRGLTVTGGLPYFGGPGNNYVTHSVATLFEILRERPGTALATAVSWFMTKHAAGCYSSFPGEHGFAVGDTSDEQERINASEVAVVGAGDLVEPQVAVVDAATVIYGRAGEVISAPVVASLGDRRRVVAVAAAADLTPLAGTSLVGEKVEVAAEQGQAPRFRIP
jgi:acetyl-CoA C-acetyltransferase